ncbi:MAG TPA: hypothetical protein PK094_08735 [Bacteroidales bacterium]|nr:hypothetical protein [Bacteroidales bacterium]HQG37261.1 hypothetical protein [Bacteroidales bacterium]HQG53754.1 hypothetical protein [Bacteroidales bacterium]
MKTLGKLKINQGKIIKNEELVQIRGGYSYFICHAICSGGLDDYIGFSSTCDEMDWQCARGQCIEFYNQVFYNCECACVNG